MANNPTSHAHESHPVEVALANLAWLAWDYRVELLPSIPALIALYFAPGPFWVPWLCGLGAGTLGSMLLLTKGRLERATVRRSQARFRRTVNSVLGLLGLPSGCVHEVRQLPNGQHVVVVVPAGMSPAVVVDQTDRIAAALHARSVTATVRLADAAIVDLVCAVGEDPLASPLASPWPGLDRAPSVVSGAVPVGVSESGETVTVRLWSRHVLAAGLPRSGKSAFLTMLLAYAMGDPTCQIVVLDPKGRDFRWASDRCHVASSQADAARRLRALVSEMERRNIEQPGRKADGVSPGHRPIVVFADELAELTALGVDRRLDDECSALLRRLAAVGPSAGISLVVATQRPSADLVPTNLRSLFSCLVCMRVQRSADAAIILGELEPGVEPHRIPRDPGWAGVGYMTTEDGRVVKMRAWYLPDAQIIATDPSTGAEALGPLLQETAVAHHRALMEGTADPLDLMDTGISASASTPTIRRRRRPSADPPAATAPDR